jgi:hypothetical protein
MNLESTTVIPPKERAVTVGRRRETYPELVGRLSRQSVTKHFDAYADVDWDNPEYRLDLDDPRFDLPEIEPLGATEWYRSRPVSVRTRIGAHMIASFMKIGLQFENVLKRGLLEFSLEMPNHSPEFRYVYHEIIEEAQHSLMFQEYVNRCGLEVDGMPRWMVVGSRHVARLGRAFPELFFMFVLGGEDPIDYMQRFALKTGHDIHPLLERIMQIHITEEARHLCFARHFLRQRVPQLSSYRKTLLTYRTPMLLSRMAPLMMQPSRQIVRQYAIPKEVVVEAYVRNPMHRQRVHEALAKVRELCLELDLVTPRSTWLWKRLGIWPRSSSDEVVLGNLTRSLPSSDAISAS